MAASVSFWPPATLIIRRSVPTFATATTPDVAGFISLVKAEYVFTNVPLISVPAPSAKEFLVSATALAPIAMEFSPVTSDSIPIATALILSALAPVPIAMVPSLLASALPPIAMAFTSFALDKPPNAMAFSLDASAVLPIAIELLPFACEVLPKANASASVAWAELPIATALTPAVIELEPNAIESCAPTPVRAFVPNARERSPSVTVLPAALYLALGVVLILELPGIVIVSAAPIAIDCSPFAVAE